MGDNEYGGGPEVKEPQEQPETGEGLTRSVWCNAVFSGEEEEWADEGGWGEEGPGAFRGRGGWRGPRGRGMRRPGFGFGPPGRGFGPPGENVRQTRQH